MTFAGAAKFSARHTKRLREYDREIDFAELSIPRRCRGGAHDFLDAGYGKRHCRHCGLVISSAGRGPLSKLGYERS